MKQTMLLLAFLAAATCGSAQTDKPLTRSITVTGSAEMEIAPDEIYVQVDLKEYEKKGSGKQSLESITKQFLQSVKLLGIPDSAVTIQAYDAHISNPWLRKKKGRDELYASISYLVKLRSSAQVDQLVNRLDDAATHNFFIQRTAHSGMEAFRRQLKIEAVKAAKEKAAYLAAAIDEKIGQAITIHEPTEYFIPYMRNMAVANVALESARDMAEAPQQADFTKLRLKYEVTVVFSLQ